MLSARLTVATLTPVHTHEECLQRCPRANIYPKPQIPPCHPWTFPGCELSVSFRCKLCKMAMPWFSSRNSVHLVAPLTPYFFASSPFWCFALVIHCNKKAPNYSAARLCGVCVCFLEEAQNITLKMCSSTNRQKQG